MRNCQASRKLNQYLEYDICSILPISCTCQALEKMGIFSNEEILIKILPLSVATLDRIKAVYWMKMFLVNVECISHSDVSGCVQILLSMWSIINILWMLWLQHNSGEFQKSVCIEYLFCCGHSLQNGHIKKEWWRI